VNKQPYPTDLTDSQSDIIQEMIPRPNQIHLILMTNLFCTHSCSRRSFFRPAFGEELVAATDGDDIARATSLGLNPLPEAFDQLIQTTISASLDPLPSSPCLRKEKISKILRFRS
jgi:hypothetical protein